ncbi:MAG: C40 family peptidase [Cyanobacteria bacterium J06639_1]
MTAPPSLGTLFQSLTSLDVFDSADCQRLATQLWPGRYGCVVEYCSNTQVARVQLLEDGYEGFIPARYLDRPQSQPVPSLPNSSPPLTPDDIRDRLPAILDYAERASQQPNRYLWGGTVGPNFDCSGIVQRSFASQGIRLPRDSYQQADFCTPVLEAPPTSDDMARLQAGDLIFFQLGRRIDHVALYWGDGRFLHSSGAQTGRNGFGWDYAIAELAGDDADDPIGHRYRQHICGVGRVTRSLPFPAIPLPAMQG